MYNCKKCNSGMIWQNDFDAEDFNIDIPDAIVSVFYCPLCDEDYYFLCDGETIRLI